MSTEVLHLPRYQELSDAELMAWSPEEFADKMIERSHLFASHFFHVDGWKVVEQDEESKRQGLAEFALRMAWREFWNGVHPPSKQIVMLEHVPEDIDIRIRLAQQIIDEVNHQRIWSQWVKKYGGNPRIQDYKVADDVKKTFQVTTGNEDPAMIAATLQCAGEVIVPYLFGFGRMNPDENIVHRCLPADLSEDIEKRIVLEEPRHIAVGRDIIIKYCGDANKRRSLLLNQIRKIDAGLPKFIYDVSLLGAERVAPLPVVA